MKEMIDHTAEPESPRRAVLCAIHTPDVDETGFRESLEELGHLGKTLGLTVAGQITQRRPNIAAGAYLGPGKVEELKQLVEADPQPTVILVDHEISPSQARNLEKETGAAEVLDRTALILEIFHRHARSPQAKLQVEIVRLAYMAPRMREAARGRGDRQRGVIGGKGAGESQMELDRRKIRDRIAELREELEQMQDERLVQRSRRQGLRRVALCGYTNAGKSTLFRALSGSEAYVADKLFATLDTTVRALQPEAKPRVLVSDTIGFIRNLPTQLVASFKSTLDEALEASLILHVVDASDPACVRHMETTNAVLGEIGAGDVPQLLVFNKIDRIEGGRPPEALLAAHPGALAVSARSPEDVARVREAIIAFFDRSLAEEELLLPYDKQALRSDIFSACQVLGEEPEEGGIRFRLRATPATLAQLRAALL